MLKNPLGAFYSIAKVGYIGAFKAAVADGATAMHLFAKSPRSANLRGEYKEDAKVAREYFEKSPLTYAVIHAGYVLNFGKPVSKDDIIFKNIVEDLHIAEALGINGVVLHMGKHTDTDPDTSRDLFVKNIVDIVKSTKHLKAKLLLENTAGQGSELGYLFTDFGSMFRAMQDKLGDDPRLGACLDTQHSFGAGYDWTDSKKAKDAIKEFDKEVGLKYIQCVHFNDSKKECGSRRDRHEDIGVGNIGSKALKNFIMLLNKESSPPPAGGGRSNIPLLLETPEVAATYAQQIQMVRDWFK